MFNSQAQNQHLKCNNNCSNCKESKCENGSNTQPCILIERLKQLCLSETMADVHFIIIAANNERIPAHKLILSLNSDVFQAMFFGSGSQMLVMDDIQLPDVTDSQPFKCMLRYLYTGEQCSLSSDWCMHALYLAKKYAVHAFERHCVNFLTKSVRNDNVFMLLEHARLFDEPELVDACLDHVDRNASEILCTSEHFYDIDSNTLETIVKRNTLSIREYTLYNCLVQWARKQCVKQQLDITCDNMKHVLGNALKQIRFTLMSAEELALTLYKQEERLIDNSIIVDLFCRLSLVNSEHYQAVHGYMFNNEPRYCINADGQQYETVNRFTQVHSRWGYSGTSDRIKLTVNRRIFIVGFGLYGSLSDNNSCEYIAVIKLIRCEENTVCGENTITFSSGINRNNDQQQTYRCMFKKPVEVLPDVEYVASATLTGPDSFYGAKGRRVVKHESNSGKVAFHFQYACGNNNGTCIESGQIPEIIFLYSC